MNKVKTIEITVKSVYESSNDDPASKARQELADLIDGDAEQLTDIYPAVPDSATAKDLQNIYHEFNMDRVLGNSFTSDVDAYWLSGILYHPNCDDGLKHSIGERVFEARTSQTFGARDERLDETQFLRDLDTAYQNYNQETVGRGYAGGSNYDTQKDPKAPDQGMGEVKATVSDNLTFWKLTIAISKGDVDLYNIESDFPAMPQQVDRDQLTMLREHFLDDSKAGRYGNLGIRGSDFRMLFKMKKPDPGVAGQALDALIDGLSKYVDQPKWVVCGTQDQTEHRHDMVEGEYLWDAGDQGGNVAFIS